MTDEYLREQARNMHAQSLANDNVMPTCPELMAAFAQKVASEQTADLRERLADAEGSLQLEAERRERAEQKLASLQNALYKSAQLQEAKDE